jgi:hypothetical protein
MADREFDVPIEIAFAGTLLPLRVQVGVRVVVDVDNLEPSKVPRHPARRPDCIEKIGIENLSASETHPPVEPPSRTRA